MKCVPIQDGLVLGSAKIFVHEEDFLKFQNLPTTKGNSCYKIQFCSILQLQMVILPPTGF